MDQLLQVHIDPSTGETYLRIRHNKNDLANEALINFFNNAKFLGIATVKMNAPDSDSVDYKLVVNYEPNK